MGTKLSHKDIGSENESDTNLSVAPLNEIYNKELLVNLPPADSFFSRVTA
jgi:hypothetical protein